MQQDIEAVKAFYDENPQKEWSGLIRIRRSFCHDKDDGTPYSPG